MKPYISAVKNYTEKPNLALFKRHTHDNYEIFWFLSGNAKYFVEGNIYDLKPNDILIIKKSETHALLINDPAPYCRYVIHFNAAALPQPQRQGFISILDNKPLGKITVLTVVQLVNCVRSKICKYSMGSQDLAEA